MHRPQSGMPAGQDFATITDELLQDVNVLVVNVVNLVDAEIVDLLPPEETSSAATRAAPGPLVS